MAKAKNLIAAAALGLGLCFPNAMTAGDINIIPTPMEMTEGTGVFRIDNNTRIASKGKEASTVAKLFAAKFKRASKITLKGYFVVWYFDFDLIIYLLVIPFLIG